jgi:hypothetical protein
MEAEEEFIQIITVSGRFLKVFTAMYPAPNQPQQLGEIAWEDVKYAMTEVGIFVTQPWWQRLSF